MAVAIAEMDHAVAVVVCAFAPLVQGTRGLTLPADAQSVTSITAYYET